MIKALEPLEAARRIIRAVGRAGVSWSRKPPSLGARLKLERMREEDESKWKPSKVR